MASSEQNFFDLLHGASSLKPTVPTEGSAVEKEMEIGDPDLGKPVTIRTIFTHHDTHPVVIDLALLKVFGVDWFTWDPSTIWSEVKRMFKTEISEHARAKIQVLKTIHSSNGPWESWQIFEKVIQGLNNNIPVWETMQAPTLDQLYAGIDIIETLRKNEFSDEVKRYIAAAVLHEEVVYVPPPLDFVQLEVSDPHYLCLDCGSEDSALLHDGVCDTCTRKFSTEQGLSMLPDPELVKSGAGTNIKTIIKNDPEFVARRWEELKSKIDKDINFEETAEDIQVAKLIVARDYMNIRRRQMADQLTSLKSWLGAD